MQQIKCTIEHIVYNNPDNGYTVMSVSQDGFIGEQTAVGIFQGVGVGTTLSLEGEWIVDKRYGRQFRVEKWMEEVPATIMGMEKYLASGLIKGIGKKYARSIVRYFGKDTINIFDNQPERLLEVDGIGAARLKKIIKSWQSQKAIREVMVFLQGHNVSTACAVKIYKQYGDKSIERVKENPYALADDIFGIGFKIADTIAQNLGYGKDDLRRCKAGVIFVLNQVSNDGHCYLDREELIKTSKELLEVEGACVEEALDSLSFEASVIEENGNYFLPMYYYSEIGVASKIKKLLDTDTTDTLDEQKGIECDIDAIEEDIGIEYDEVQREAIRVAARSKVLILTGGPGSGKTTVTKGIIAALEMRDNKILCAAPTGRAAKRMSEATGKDAQTIHRLLEYNPEGGFGRNENNKLGGDVLIVDESSMIDILLMNSLLKAVPDKMRVVFVGDIDQLPSVGAGNVLRDMIDSDVVPVVRLTKIFRQALTSRIVTNAHKVNHGEFPDISNGRDADFFFIKQEDARLAAENIVNIVSERVPNAFKYTSDDIQVLVPMKNGVAGSISLNIALQEAINPTGSFIQHGQFKYRVGDKVMQIKNNYEKNVFNGDVGVITDIDVEDGVLRVRYDNVVEYERGELNEITLAYACTIHKSQGSEYPVVVIPLLMSHYIMLQRNLVYTGITRAKKICIIVGDTKALAMAVKNFSVQKRNTMLKERLMA